MTQHTPGPWRHVGATFPERPRIYPPKNHVDMNYKAALNSRLDEYEANARLIAAAPDLLLHLERVTAWLTTLGGDKSLDPEIAGLCDDYANETYAAIAKAKGDN